MADAERRAGRRWLITPFVRPERTHRPRAGNARLACRASVREPHRLRVHVTQQVDQRHHQGVDLGRHLRMCVGRLVVEHAIEAGEHRVMDGMDPDGRELVLAQRNDLYVAARVTAMRRSPSPPLKKYSPCGLMTTAVPAVESEKYCHA